MINNKIAVYMLLLFICFTVKTNAGQKKIEEIIPQDTFFYVNINDINNINQLPLSEKSIFSVLFLNTPDLNKNTGIVLSEGLSYVYINPMNILKSPTYIGKISQKELLKSFIKKKYNIKENKHNNVPVFMITEPQKKGSKIVKTIGCLTYLDDYFILSSSLTEVRNIIDAYSGKNKRFSESIYFKQTEEVLTSSDASVKFFINIETPVRIYGPLVKKFAEVSISSMLVQGEAFTPVVIKDIANANIEEIFSYLDQVSFLSAEYNKNSNQVEVFLKFKENTPLAGLTEIEIKKLNLFDFLPYEGVLLAWTNLDNYKIKQNYFNYVFSNLVKYDTSRISNKPYLDEIQAKQKMLGGEDLFAWVNGPEGLVLVNIFNRKETKDRSSMVENRFGGLGVFFKSRQKWIIEKGKTTELNRIKIQNEKVKFTPVSANFSELAGYNNYLSELDVWSAQVDDKVILTVEKSPVIMNKIIGSLKNKNPVLGAKLGKALKANSKAVMFFSSNQFKKFVNNKLSSRGNNNMAKQYAMNLVSIFDAYFPSEKVVVNATAKNHGFHYILSPFTEKKVKKILKH